MTAFEKQSIHACLEHYGRIEACEIAHRTSHPLETVYEALVSLESAGVARVEVTHIGKRVSSREWVAA